jgi:hypothetical protein
MGLKNFTQTQKTGQVCSSVKVMLTVFFYCDSVIHHEFLSHGQTMNKQYYLKFMRRLREAVRRKGPDFWRGGKNGCSIITMFQCIHPF